MEHKNGHKKASSGEGKTFCVMTVGEFLGAPPAETELNEITLRLAAALKRERLARGLTQAELAKKLKNQQPNIARMELGVDRTVSIDNLMHALLVLGMSSRLIAEAVAGETRPTTNRPNRHLNGHRKAAASSRGKGAKVAG